LALIVQDIHRAQLSQRGRPLSDNPYWLVGVQLLDGVGAGIYGAVFPVIVADLMRGTGRFNVAQGAIITAQGIGAALSTTLAVIVVVQAGYSAAFLTLAGVAIVELGLPTYAPQQNSTGFLSSVGAQ
jgi:MFS family permease